MIRYCVFIKISRSETFPNHSEAFPNSSEGNANHSEAFANHSEGNANRSEAFANHSEGNPNCSEAFANSSERNPNRSEGNANLCFASYGRFYADLPQKSANLAGLSGCCLHFSQQNEWVLKNTDAVLLNTLYIVMNTQQM